ncbi:PAS domain-containing methyl-accepting chemotaxis protein [Halioxenophilus sp. WMMB6]|uniref:methyl-accepting chemotaxis protein n=1 Tax=Halioxenophilus sp. WMMB6 TaxID=3073815 RepID=UPI00295EFF99|nr:PAS domain-containing methyl-accepting chemotaxis protein [Halioxenophilus sp. WMMB6]
MRKMGPVTQKEVMFGKDEQLVSSTTTKGVITFCNDTFSRIAGFSAEELQGQAHNIVRHPDMPAAAFAKMWQDLKSGHHWMGLVKNRCKNGDHYWVDAYVTPLRERGEITGYESVRVAPTREQVERAEQAYARINQGKNPVPTAERLWSQYHAPLLTLFMVLLPALAGLWLLDKWSPVTALITALISAVVSLAVVTIAMAGTRQLLRESREIIHDPLAAYLYSGRCDAEGEILFAQMATKARLRTALSRFNESSRFLVHKSSNARQHVQDALGGMSAQQRESMQVAESMDQMAQAVQEVATGVTQTSDATVEALNRVKSGESVIVAANCEINELSSTVAALGEVLSNLSGGSEKIASVIDVIRGIADQTNLLALNAAIEAARAGEQGRGFSVVADEVRSLAQRTQESTQDIQKIIEELGAATLQAVKNMDTCRDRSQRSVESIDEVNQALSAITQSVSSIERMSQQIAAAAEEQSSVAVEVNNNTQNISQIARTNEMKASEAADLSAEMYRLAEDQLRLIERFR